ncbi:GNAT family N-acetyltransferase [Mycolicibacterium fortuitum]|uniref:GNAT family N-acetyltransferase n=1 Tax=Mycolicibacterium fortuitum TaxID=1766 RepID=UPI00261C3375|nr:GNAT family N-acetyltransferase [Mycolicibacterium fortuitum]
MARHSITVQRACEEELSDLASWYTMIDPEMLDRPADEVNARFVNALRSGVLGCALGHGRDSVDVLLEHIDLDEQLLSRILVLSARCDGETVGMLLCSPPVGFYNDVMAQTVAYPQRTVQQMHVAFVVGLVKLEMVAVAPEHRGRGLGARLVRNAIDTARKSAVERIYGQFHNEDGLTGFYEKLGFTVPGPGQAISAVSDFPIQIHSSPSETPFHQTVGPPARLF